MNLTSFFLITVSSWNFVLAGGINSKKNALIFNAQTQQLDEIDQRLKFLNKCPSCIFACPASSKDQKLIIEEASITGNAIFFQVAVKNGMKNNECGESFRPAMVQNTWISSYEIGYELFYPEGEIQLKFENYKHLSKIKVIYDNEENKSKTSSPKAKLVKKIEQDGNTKFEIFEQSRPKLVFYWISVLSIQFSIRGRQIYFVKDSINNIDQRQQNMIICKDYNLGDELNKVPSEKWERLENEELKQLTDFDLEETQIMPMRYFHTLSTRLATCTFLNIAYVWKGIAVGQYRKIDLYLYSLYRQWPADINIIFGIKGVSKGVTNRKLEKIKTPENKILEKFPIPVPEIIFRIVEYKQNDKISNVVIVLHNFLGSVPVEERVCPGEDEVQGWDDIKPDPKSYPQYTEPSGLTYACPITTDTIGKLGIPYQLSASMEIFTLNASQRIKIIKYVQETRAKAADRVDVE